ncbi:hypothetical protein ES708_24855 [subsurface metagenome]
MYYSTGEDLGIGSHAIIWNRCDQGGNTVPPGEYYYYLYGYDNVNNKVKVVQSDEWIVYRMSAKISVVDIADACAPVFREYTEYRFRRSTVDDDRYGQL